MSATKPDQPPLAQSSHIMDPAPAPDPVEKRCIVAILIMGFLQAFNARLQLSGDTISYLDLSDLWLKGDIANAVNGYWNPVYPILLSFACKFVDAINQPLSAHILNIGLLTVNLWLFKWLLREVREFRRSQGAIESEGDEMFTVFAYLLFAWTHLALIDLSNLTPDLVVMSSVIAAATLLFRLLQDKNALSSAAALGAVLAFGYLTKAIMFVAASFFILAAMFCARTIGKGIRHSTVAGIVFVMLSSPYIFLLSRQQGHLTYSASGRLAYSWMVNQTTPWFHWQGREPGSGTPEHPTRQLSEKPAVFEFGDRLGTYPPWFDPSYWNKGLQVHIDLKKQLKAINKGLIECYSIFFGQAASIVFLILFAVGLRRAELRNHPGLLRVWPLLIPALAVCGSYVLVLVLDRYVAPFALVAYMALLINSWLAVHRLLPRRVLFAMAGIGMLPIIFTICGQTTKANLFKRAEETEQRRVAIGLQRLGLKPGDRIAVLGRGCNARFARLGRFKIIAEGFRQDGEIPLWAQRPEFEMQAVEALKKTHPKAIVRDIPAEFKSNLNWKVIPNTQFAALLPQ